MFRAHFVIAAIIGAVATAPANAQEPVPAVLDNLKAHEVVEAIISEAKTLGLTSVQLRQLDSLHVAVRDERHQWVPTSGNKAHTMLKMRPMISPDRAYNHALKILTPSQRSAVSKRFDDAAYVPVVPSLADELPPSLDGLKPHEIPEALVAERQKLGLSDDQATNLQNLHVAIRDEPHRYVQAQHGAKGHPHMMMEPMISKRRAYNDAMSYLTADQQAAANQLFRARDYKPKLAPAAKK